MIIDGTPFREYARVRSSGGWPAISAFIAFIERKTGATVLFDRRRFAFGRVDLADAINVASLLREHAIVDSFNRIAPLCDDPPFKSWACRSTNEKTGAEKFSGGASVDSDTDALHAALAEALERYLWRTQTDYFVKPIRTTSADISKRGLSISPERFLGFSSEQRELNPKLTLTSDTTYLWIQGESLLSGKKIYIPAQIASAAAHSKKESSREPLIRMPTTIGLATWPEKKEARLRGALECIERDAYTIMWLNQLTLPRISLAPLREKIPSLDVLLERCDRYRLKVHATQMITDAPTHAICAVVEDMSGYGPRFAFGLKAHRSIMYAVEKATLEALRARRTYRGHSSKGVTWDTKTPVEKIDHIGRMFYWGEKPNAEKLSWITEGREVDALPAPWEDDTSEQHLEKIIVWCRAKNYDCIAVSPGISKANPTKWHVEMMVMPDLQPAYLHESMRHITGERLASVPRQFGYNPREAPYTEGPHPFV